MVRDDILGGLISALIKGETLRTAMISMYNAGYDKREIEWAARTLQMQGYEQVSQPQSPLQKKEEPKEEIKKPEEKKEARVVSLYKGEPEKKQIFSPETVKKDMIPKRDFSPTKEEPKLRDAEIYEKPKLGDAETYSVRESPKAGKESIAYYTPPKEKPKLEDEEAYFAKELKRIDRESSAYYAPPKEKPKIEDAENYSFNDDTSETGRQSIAYPQTNLKYFGEQKKSSGTLLIIILVIILLFLLGILGLVIFFKDDLITFFNNLF